MAKVIKFLKIHYILEAKKYPEFWKYPLPAGSVCIQPVLSGAYHSIDLIIQGLCTNLCYRLYVTGPDTANVTNKSVHHKLISRVYCNIYSLHRLEI